MGKSTTSRIYIGFSKASTELTPTGKPFDLRRIAPGDKKLMGRLKAGDTIRDMEGNLYRKEVVKGTKWKQVDKVPGNAPKLKVNSLDNPAVAKAKGFVEVDGKFYKRQKVEKEKWVPAQNTEQAKDISYNPETEMLIIKMPDKPFTINRKGVGRSPSE